jgi:hypothetical protein
MAQDWETPTSYSAAPAQPSAAEMSAAYALRPLSVGEILDRTFSVYRSHFWLFAGIASFSGAVSVVVNAINLLGHHLILNREGFKAASISSSIGSIVVSIAFLLAAAITQAATVYALSAVYLGRTATVQESFRGTVGRWYRWVGIALWQGWSAMWVALILIVPAFAMIGFAAVGGNFGMRALAGLLIVVAVLGGGVYGVIAYIRNSLGVQAAIIEGLTVRPSMRRSKVLTSGTKGRIFVVLLISFVLYLVASAIQGPLLLVMMHKPLEEHVVAQIIVLLIGFVSHTLISPVSLIGLTLVYFDQRVRNEAFDILMLLGPEGAAPVEVAEPAVWPPVAPVEAASPPVAPTEPAAWPPVAPSMEATPMAVPPMETAHISAEPISTAPIDESVDLRTDDETLP